MAGRAQGREAGGGAAVGGWGKGQRAGPEAGVRDSGQRTAGRTRGGGEGRRAGSEAGVRDGEQGRRQR